MAQDGGAFALFPTIEDGLSASKDLLRSSAYANLPFESAMRRWSGNGYGSDVAPQFKNRKIKDLTDKEIDVLIEHMKRREGWITS